MEKKLLYFKDIEKGRQFMPYYFKVDEETILKYCEAIGEKNPIFNDAEAAKKMGYAGLLAPPTTACIYTMKGFLDEVEMPPGCIHAGQIFDFKNPAIVGDELTTNTTVLDKYEKRGKKFVIIEAVTKNQAGQDIVRSRMNVVWAE